MKKLIAFLLILSMAVSLTLSTFAEEETDEQFEALIDSLTNEVATSEEEKVYKEYFKKAFVYLKGAKNVCVNTSNFFYIAANLTDTKYRNYSFLKDLKSPLELTKEQIELLMLFKEKGEEKQSYNSYISSSLHAAVSFGHLLPSYLLWFSLTEKPSVPLKYKTINDYLEIQITEVQKYYDALIEYLNGKVDTRPSYDDTFYSYLLFVYNLL